MTKEKLFEVLARAADFVYDGEWYHVSVVCEEYVETVDDSGDEVRFNFDELLENVDKIDFYELKKMNI